MMSTGIIENYAVCPGAYYIPNFITEDEENYLIRKIKSTPRPKWKTLGNRRLQIWGGEITTKGTLVCQQMPPFVSDFPDIISRIRATGVFSDSPHKQPNHIIMNEYLAGQGIMPHEDGPQYHPVVATVSLGTHTVFHYYRYKPDGDEVSGECGNGKVIDQSPVLSILLEPRSLIISSAEMYTSHLHGIDTFEEDVIASDYTDNGVTISNLDMLQDLPIKAAIAEGRTLKRGIRYSLTCRDVGRTFTTGTRR